MKYIPIKNKSIKAVKQSENAITQTQKNSAVIEYLAMMTDVELESEVEEDEAQ